jgi:hypothetical protein
MAATICQRKGATIWCTAPSVLKTTKFEALKTKGKQTFSSINAAKRASWRIQQDADGRLGAGTLQIKR